MWVTSLKIKHDCVIGNRCSKFNVSTSGMPFNVYIEKGITYSTQIQTLHGTDQNVAEFIIDIKKDKRIKNFEQEGNTIFFTEIRLDKIPSSFHTMKLIYVKPVLVDTNGYEYWEVASGNKSNITDFISKLKKQKNILFIEILKIEDKKVTDVYFSHLSPKLSTNQKNAIELAYKYGYYSWPKRTNLQKLAKLQKISVSTYREHLKRAEERLIPELIKSIN